MSAPVLGVDSDDLRVIAAAQRDELMAAQAVESDFDLAFRLQLQEAITASLSLQPSSSSSSLQNPVLSLPKDDVLRFTDLQSEELSKLEQEINDRVLSESEFKNIRDDLHRRIHDERVAREIDQMPEDEWQDIGDNYERPYGEGTSKSVNSELFRVYFKGLVEKYSSKMVLGGIGVAICDSRDELLFELEKPFLANGISRQIAELKALIEALDAAISLELKRVTFYCDYYPIFQFVSGRWSPKQRKVVALVNQVTQLRQKFTYSHPSFIARNDVKFAFKLAREAIVSRMNKPVDSSGLRNLYETCAICLEDTETGRFFSVDGCLHHYCFSCMKQHVEVKLLHGMVPKCPHENCNLELRVDSCSQFLTPKLIEIMRQRVKEASIPVTEKVYCPNPQCSALMSKREALENSKTSFVGAEITGARKCIKCSGCFCINCKVRWHTNMTCNEYRSRNPNPLVEDAKLKSLAARNLWRQCVKCNHMIELAAGCYHMTCRCGYEFCYTCGAEWKNKKATCTCPLWHEENIIDDSDEDEYDEQSDDEDDYDSDSDYYY